MRAAKLDFKNGRIPRGVRELKYGQTTRSIALSCRIPRGVRELKCIRFVRGSRAGYRRIPRGVRELKLSEQ